MSATNGTSNNFADMMSMKIISLYGCEFDKDSVEKFLLDNGLKSCYSEWTSKWINDIQAQNFEQEDAIDEIIDILNS